MPLLWRQRVLGTKFAVSGLNLFRLFRSKIWPSQQGYSHSCPDFDFAQNSFRLFVFVFLSLSLSFCARQLLKEEGFADEFHQAIEKTPSEQYRLV